MKTSIVALLVVFGLVLSVYGDDYPISPRPLRMLVEESQYIITGRVTEIIELQRKEKKITYTDHYAVISVVDVLQGDISANEVRVAFEPNMICPSPPTYIPGTTVIAFLDKHKEEYVTHALSYGAKIVSDSALKVYKVRIAEIQRINKMTDGLDKFMATVEWLVRCAENPDTRWEGTYELSPQSDFMSYYSRTEHLPFSSMLSAEQRGRLKTALFAAKNAESVDLGLADLVYVGNEKEVHSYLLTALKNISGSGYYFVGALMDRLKLLTNDPHLDKLMKRYDAICWEHGKEAEKKKIIAEFVAVLEKPMTQR
ncbi:MAG TPA: hypothetical protein VGD40_09340 [Chryseosolibacter sp.]